MIYVLKILRFLQRFLSISVFVFLVIFLLSATNIFSQPELGKTVYGNEKRKSAPKPKPSAPTKKNVPQKKKTIPAAVVKKIVPAPRTSVNRFVAKTSAPRTKKFQAQKPLQVIFTGKEPFVEVWINDKNVGATDKNSKFIKNLVPGEYRLMARTNKYIFLPTRRITVNENQTSFNLFVETTSVSKPRVDETPADKTNKGKSEIEIALEISQKVKEILEAYNNPATTDSITPEDWEIVFRAAQLGQLQGYTAVMIEAQRWFASGQIELSKKEYTNALTAFKKAQEYMPTSALPFYAMGETYFANKQYLDAARMYQKTLQINPNLAQGYKKFGDTQRLLNKPKEAITAYKNAIQNGYKTPETRLWLGSLMLENKQVEEALAILEDVSKETPKPEIFILIGTGYEKLKRDVSAIGFYQKAIEVDPKSVIAYYKLGDVYLNQREYDKAKESFEKAISLDPEGKFLNRSEAQKKAREAAAKQNK